MNDSETLHALEYIDADLIEAAEAAPKKRHSRPYWFAAIAAVLILAIGLGIAFGGSGAPTVPTNPPQLGSIPTTGPFIPTNPPLTYLLAAPVYPEMAARPNPSDFPDYKDYDLAYTAWRQSQNQQYAQPQGYADSLKNFFHSSMAQFLQGEGNTAYSPVNVYMAMAMLAETTGGNSRQQILDLFGLDSIADLRKQAKHMWNAHYCADGQTNLLLGNSLWLDDAYSFKKETADLLANRYYASSFHGDLGTEEMNELLRSWLNENTGGLLKDQAENVELSPYTAFALTSTVYFTAAWENEFFIPKTKDAIFHSPDGDISASFMNETLYSYMCYWSDNFIALALDLSGNNRMWLILPDEGYTVADILESEDYLQMVLKPGAWQNKKEYKVNLSLPKFDVSDQKDLIDGMKAMGVTDIFDDELSDFSPMTDTPELIVRMINHAARVTIDEKGCTGAAFTVVETGPTSVPMNPNEIDFVLDRPFLFVVSSRDNLPLFAGVVNHP